MLRLVSLLLMTMLLLQPVKAATDSCPQPIVQLATDIKGKIDGTVDTFLKLGQLKTAGDVDVLTKDVLSSYPNADKVALQQNSLSILCNKVLSSPDYSKEIKEKIIQKLLDTLSDIKPDPITNLTKAFPIGNTSIDFVKYALGTPRQERNGVAEFPRNNLLLEFRYALSNMQTVVKNNIYEIDVFPDNFVDKDIRAISIDGSEIVVSQTYVSDIFDTGATGTPCRMRKAFRIRDDYYLDCVKHRYFLSNTSDHSTDIDNFIWMEQNFGKCIPISHPPEAYLRRFIGLFNQYDLSRQYQSIPPTGDVDCEQVIDFMQANIGALEIDYAISWKFIIDGVGILGPDDPLVYIPEDRISAASYIVK